MVLNYYTNVSLSYAITFGARSLPYMAFISKDGETTSQVGSLGKDQLKYFLEGLISK